MKIKLTDFALRHFDPKFGGTKILDKTALQFEAEINHPLYLEFFDLEAFEGYAPFCKLWPIKNFTDARVGSLPITLTNYQYLRSGYSARRDSELPVFSRWLDLPVGKPKAEYLMLVLYSQEQVNEEAKSDAAAGKNHYTPFDADWGIVAILGQSHAKEEPMKPETMIRNSLGIKEGGSGHPLNREAYLKSVEFWEVNATVK